MPKKVMIVSDSNREQNMLRMMLNDTSYLVEACCRNGIEAIEQYDTVNPDVVVMDFMMSDMDGITAARSLLHNHSDANIVMMFESVSPCSSREIFDIGVKHYIVKPFDRARILGVLDRIFKYK